MKCAAPSTVQPTHAEGTGACSRRSDAMQGGGAAEHRQAESPAGAGEAPRVPGAAAPPGMKRALGSEPFARSARMPARRSDLFAGLQYEPCSCSLCSCIVNSAGTWKGQAVQRPSACSSSASGLPCRPFSFCVLNGEGAARAAFSAPPAASGLALLRCALAQRCHQ